MTLHHRSSVLIAALGSLTLLLSGCMSTKPQAFKLSFFPSTPLSVDAVLMEPPPIERHYFTNASPNLVERTITTPVRPPEVESRMVRAQEHFETGKRLYQVGDTASARQEFDRAIDLLLSAPENLPERQRLEHKLDQMVEAIYKYDLDGLGAGVPQQEVVYDNAPKDSILDLTFPTDPNLRPKVKEELEATVSQLPLEENDAVLGFIHYFSTDRGHKILTAGLRRAGRYRPLIQRILDEEGVPQELIYLAQIESGFSPRARSNKAAVGMWQFIQFRGREYGLNQTPSSDDRMDPEKATRAAARHLHDLYAMFGDWYLAMAAYNCGPGCVDRAVQRTGYADYWELVRRNVLPRDTNNYVPAILALTIMAKNPKDYDLLNLDLDQPVEYDTIDIEAATNLALIADATDRPIPDIQDLNPSLLKPIAPAGYQLRVPKGSMDLVRMALAEVPAEHRATWRIHRVTQDETLAEIARRFNTPAASITAANRLPVDLLDAGDTLIIPVNYSAPRPSARAAKPGVHAPIRRSAANTTASKKTAATPVRRASAPALPGHKNTAAKSAPVRTASIATKRSATTD